jgi:hypothetical protein
MVVANETLSKSKDVTAIFDEIAKILDVDPDQFAMPPQPEQAPDGAEAEGSAMQMRELAAKIDKTVAETEKIRAEIDQMRTGAQEQKPTDVFDFMAEPEAAA